MKVLILPDVHLHTELVSRVAHLLDEHVGWHCVSLGDWVDNWGATPLTQGDFLDYFATFCEKYQDRLHLCWGNHDYGYWAHPNSHTGYDRDAELVVRTGLRAIQSIVLIKMARINHKVIFSHAGLSLAQFRAYKTALHRVPNLSFIGFCNNRKPERYWDNDSVIWRRPHSNRYKNTFNPKFLQVVGHTPVMTITHTEEDNILYTDTWSTDSDRNPIGDRSLVVVDTETQTWEVIPYADQ